MRYTLLLLLSLLLSKPILAQQIVLSNAATKKFLLKEAENAKFHLVYPMNGGLKGEQQFHKIVLDTALSKVSESTFKLIGEYTLRDMAIGINYSAIALTNKANDQIKLYIERDGQRATELLVILPTSYKWVDAKVFLLPGEKSYLLLYTSDKRTWNLTALNIRGLPIWTDVIHSSKPLDLREVVRCGNALFIVRSENFSSRKQKNYISTYDLSDGKKIFEYQLFEPTKNKAIDNIIVKDDRVYIAGRQFNRPRIKNTKMEDPFLISVDTTMQVTNYSLNRALAHMQFFPIDVASDISGNKFLIGETFTSESFLPYMLKGVGTSILTLGFLSVTWCNLKFNDVVVTPLNNADEPPQIISLPPRRATIGHHLAAYKFASYAVETGHGRYFGEKNGYAYLLNGRTLVKRSLTEPQFQKLGDIPKQAENYIIRVFDNRVITFDTPGTPRTIRFASVPFIP